MQAYKAFAPAIALTMALITTNPAFAQQAESGTHKEPAWENIFSFL